MKDDKFKTPYGCMISLGEVFGYLRTMLYERYNIASEITATPNKPGSVVYQLLTADEDKIPLWLGFQNFKDKETIKVFVQTETGGLEQDILYKDFDYRQTKELIKLVRRSFEAFLHDTLQIKMKIFESSAPSATRVKHLGVLSCMMTPNFEMCSVRFLLVNGDEVTLTMPIKNAERASNKDKFTLVNGSYSYYPHLELN